MREILIFGAAAFALVLGLTAAMLAASYYEVGIASWYGLEFHGKQTANGEVYDMYGISAAHKTLPFGTILQVVDLDTGKTVVVRINDRGPFIKGRIIDLSYGAAQELGMVEKGLAKVGLRVVEWPAQ